MDRLQLILYTNQPHHVNHWQVSTIDHHIKMQWSDGKLELMHITTIPCSTKQKVVFFLNENTQVNITC